MHPKCGLCTKRGIECVYKDGLNIVLVDPASRSHYGASSRSRSRGSTWSSLSSVQSAATPQDLPQTCLVTSYRLQTNAVFLESYFPSSRSAFTVVTDSSPGVSTAWLSTTYDLSLTDGLLSDALSALSLAYIERQDAFGGTLYRSQAMYGRAMRALLMRLNDQHEIMEDATLAAAMALTAYEVGEVATTRWQSNGHAVTKCVKSRRAWVGVSRQRCFETSPASRQQECSNQLRPAAFSRLTTNRCKLVFLPMLWYKLIAIEVHQ